MKTNLATFDRPIEAEVLSSFLHNYGVEADVEDERRLQRYWFLASPRAGIHVVVPNRQYEAAHHLLDEKAGNFLLRKAVHCPACKSSRVQYPAMTRKNLLPALVAHVLVACGVIRHEYYCEDCHNTWSPL